MTVAPAIHSSSPDDVEAQSVPYRSLSWHLSSDAEVGELLDASHLADDRERSVTLSVPDIHCGGCIAKIEKAVAALESTRWARVNLSTRRLTVRWNDQDPPPKVISALEGLGYRAHIMAPDEIDESDGTRSSLVRALAVAGFASGNIMLLSVSVWSGAADQARDLFHVISAVIAIPAIAYSGRVFFVSAWRALRHRHANMDVPISIGVLLACAMSVFDTAQGREHAYFDAAVMLLFFLLIGRVLDHETREKARGAVRGLSRLVPRTALVLTKDGAWERVPVADIRIGSIIRVAVGDRVPVDGIVSSGRSTLDRSIVTGESQPHVAGVGASVQSGVLNLSSDLEVEATADEAGSFLAAMKHLVETAETARPKHTPLSNSVSRFYAPAVHLAALAGFSGWFLYGGDPHQSISIAIAVLIITCPCALGLAAPIIQVVAARRLFELGIMVKDAAALERLADVDTVVFDKTGTLTTGDLSIIDQDGHDPTHLALAKAMAKQSRHPHARALVRPDSRTNDEFQNLAAFEQAWEHPGDGLEARSGDDIYRLGRIEWACDASCVVDGEAGAPRTALSRNGECMAVFKFDDRLRTGAESAMAGLIDKGMEVQILSGDIGSSVETVANRLGGVEFQADKRPAEKTAHIEALGEVGRKTLFVGDGLNDAPALRAAHVSMAPSSAADIGRNAADIVFLRDDLEAVGLALEIARRAARMTRQNLTFAVLYNLLALPIALAGLVTPLIAALAMSGSSIIVVLNALRLNPPGRGKPEVRGKPGDRARLETFVDLGGAAR
jgi:P-type Cu2+ transporter